MNVTKLFNLIIILINPNKRVSIHFFCSVAGTPTLPRLEICVGDSDLNLQVHTLAGLRHHQSSSTPSTPEMQTRRGHYIRSAIVVKKNFFKGSD